MYAKEYYLTEASLKKMLFPVQRPGEYVRADWELFFLFFSLFSPILLLLFSYQNKEKRETKRFCGRPTGHNFGYPLDRKQTFF